MIPVYLLTNNNHLWLLPGFTYLWNRYCNQPVTVFGYDAPNNLPDNFTFHSLGQQLPASQWSNGLLRLLDNAEKYFILTLEDYWLYESVDMYKITTLSRLINDNVLRVDLSGNRASYKQAIEIMPNMVETFGGTPYQMSFQAAIWHRDNLRKVLKKGENPWQAEINGSKRVRNLRVLGTDKALLKYQPVWRSQQKRWQLDKIKTDDLEYMRDQGWLTPNHD